MWKVLVVLLLAAEIMLLMNMTAEARICIPIYREFEECQPRDGSEPPAWCGEYPNFWQRLRLDWEPSLEALRTSGVDIFWWIWR